MTFVPFDTTTVLRQPLYANRPGSVPVQQPSQPPNLLLTTLAAPAAPPFRQSDQPSPSRPTLRWIDTGAPNLLCGTLAPAQTPFALDDWPVPAAPKVQQPFQPPNLAPSLPIAPPFVESDWPNPTPLRDSRRVDNPPNILLSPGAIGIAPPTRQLDWPIPQPGRVTRAEIPPNLLLTPGIAAPFRQTDWPNPPANPPVRQPEIPPNIIEDPGIAPPFRQTDWPNPPAKAPALQADIPQELLLTPGIAPPFKPIDWPNPSINVPARQADAPPNLLAWTLAPRPPFSQPDWSIPRQTARQQPDVVPNLSVGELDVPFVFDDWPIPRPLRVLQPETVPNLSTTTLAPRAIPFNQDDWSIPAQTIRQQPDVVPNLALAVDRTTGLRAPLYTPTPQSLRVSQPEIVPNLLGTTLTPSLLPFNQTDWPNPPTRVTVRASDARPNLFLTPGIAPPFSQSDWPTPSLPARIVPDIQPNLSTTTLAPTPFSQDDWPRPQVSVSTPLSDPPNLLATTLSPPTPFPFSLADWPNPKPPLPTPLTDPPNVIVETIPTITGTCNEALSPLACDASATVPVNYTFFIDGETPKRPKRKAPTAIPRVEGEATAEISQQTVRSSGIVRRPQSVKSRAAVRLSAFSSRGEGEQESLGKLATGASSFGSSGTGTLAFGGNAKADLGASALLAKATIVRSFEKAARGIGRPPAHFVAALHAKARRFLRAQGSVFAIEAAAAYRKATKADADKVKDILDSLHLDWADFGDDIQAELVAAFEAGGETALSAVLREQEAKALFGVLNPAATDYATTRGAELVAGIQETTREGLRALIGKAFTEGLSPTQLAKEITDSTLFSDSRAEMIARTEVASAQTAGALQGWKESGVVEGVQWLLSDDHPGPDECDDNEADGVIALGDMFSSGDEGPPVHPGCECDIAPVVIGAGEE